MDVAGEKLRFALDHNFAVPVVRAMAPLMPRVELVPIAEIDEGFAELDDWQLFAALHNHDLPWDGLITNDVDLLRLPKEMTVLSQTNLTLVVAVGEGHSPIRSVGVLLCHLNHICRHSRADLPQVWTLRVRQKNGDAPLSFLENIAERTGTTADALFAQYKLPPTALRRRRG